MEELWKKRNIAIYVSALALLACSDDAAPGVDAAVDTDAAMVDAQPLPPPPVLVSSDFESGNIGDVEQVNFLEPELVMSLRNDNDDPTLRDSWRTWWYARLDSVATDRPLTITINNRGWETYYVPVYSYDQTVWYRFEDSEVDQPNLDSIRMVKQFEESTVWVARFYPYTLTDLQLYMDSLAGNQYVTREVIGTSEYGRDIEMLTITDSTIPMAGKERVWLHGRTHPAETGSSFLLEGLIDFLLSNDPDAQAARENLVFNIVPMHNPDGVVVGNYRTTPDSYNLESMWFFDELDPWLLTPETPVEVHILRDAMAASMTAPDAIPVTAALNLHSSNSPPERPVFFFPHFGPESLGYTVDEARLWDSHVSFITSVERYYGEGFIDDIPDEAGRFFATANYPETWWWLNLGADVMAITLETVYGQAGFAPEWVTPTEIEDLGLAVGLALLEYHGLPVTSSARLRATPRASTLPPLGTGYAPGEIERVIKE